MRQAPAGVLIAAVLLPLLTACSDPWPAKTAASGPTMSATTIIIWAVIATWLAVLYMAWALCKTASHHPPEPPAPPEPPSGIGAGHNLPDPHAATSTTGTRGDGHPH